VLIQELKHKNYIKNSIKSLAQKNQVFGSSQKENQDQEEVDLKFVKKFASV